MEKMTKKEWLERGKQLFGEDITKWKFVCPVCGHISSVKDFVDLGGDANDAFQKCIGRLNQKKTGCDWAAYGLFGTLGKGILIDEKTEAFKFAE